MLPTLCIYHAHCTDGYGAAWAVKRYFDLVGRPIEFHAGIYNEDSPDVTDRDVILVDFSYKRAVLEGMLEQAASITVIDHHKSAIEDLIDLKHPKLKLSLSSDNSGCVLAWDYFFPHLEAPLLLQHIEDRDLWLFNMVGTREILAAVNSYPFDFELWRSWAANPGALKRLSDTGESLLRAHAKLVAAAVAEARRENIAGHSVFVVNCAPHLASDVGEVLATGEAFSASYRDNATHQVFSLRSSKDGIDVSEIAKQYGGGGHRHAAGFSVALPTLFK